MRLPRRSLAAVWLVGAVLASSGCAASPPSSVPPRASTAPSAPNATSAPDAHWAPSGEPATLATDLDAPWSVVPLDGGGAVISERDSGTVRELTSAGDLRTIGVVPGVVSGGESGLHGLAIRVDDAGDRWLYAYHGASHDNRVVRMPLRGDAGSLAIGDPEPILTGIPRANTHDGGRIAFGPDGYLYVTTGDAQNQNAPQDPDALGGKILRLTPEGDPAPGNPFGNAVWTLGHRNVQGLAWTADGQLWASEFGQNEWDEINRIVPGANYGWPIVEGDAGDDRFTDPVVTWATSEASPSGIAAVGRTVFVAGLRGERLWVVDMTESHTAEQPRVGLDGQGRLRDVVAAPDGTLWILTNNTDGRGSPRNGDDILIRLPIAPVP
ncbi:Glucose/arabinose dehydrogenase, beta-propeller fold [Microbacterium sp. cf046]|uniref:PQQ-dependent sugar dehydrogenase n=1 Tax=Microbacterium sp. cf046 TaxID=1761803 RepID=UPI0008E9058A|nr:Glucose/arabinose dehydrogenase, beta-propeller fold [Microbacterium sp. cf046]